MQGRVIGVNSQIKSDSGGNDGVGFAIPSKTVKSIADRLIAGGSVEHAYLGVSIDDAATGGAHVGRVSSGTPAAQAGSRPGTSSPRSTARRSSRPRTSGSRSTPTSRATRSRSPSAAPARPRPSTPPSPRGRPPRKLRPPRSVSPGPLGPGGGGRRSPRSAGGRSQRGIRLKSPSAPTASRTSSSRRSRFARTALVLGHHEHVVEEPLDDRRERRPRAREVAVAARWSPRREAPPRARARPAPTEARSAVDGARAPAARPAGAARA